MKIFLFPLAFIMISFASCKNMSNTEANIKDPNKIKLAEQNISRAMAIVDSTIALHFTDNSMARFYNPYTGIRSKEKASVWMYTSSIEAVNAILHSLKMLKESGETELYDKNFTKYVTLLEQLYEDLDYYKGTFTLTSYTQTKEWSVYAVDRVTEKGQARVEGIYNVYDDQQWLARELLDSYKLTENKKYLDMAEYLTEYVLDGWDCTMDENGTENGGITWGPGYTTKHACSNGPMVSPLVWLYEIYKDKNDEVEYLFIDNDQSRKSQKVKKSELYLSFAEKVYNWQKENLLREDGVYADMMGGCDPDCKVSYETINGVEYRKHTILRKPTGKAYTYNCGTMISGAADLFRATKNNTYLEDGKKLSDASFAYFAKINQTVPDHYTYPIDGFSNWFNGILMRGYVDIYPSYKDVDKSIESFQQNLDYGYENFIYKGVLPSDLLQGWKEKVEDNSTEGMFSFTFAAEYANLARFILMK